MPSSSVHVDGVELRVHRTGRTEPTVVLVHGIADSGLCWARLAEALEAHYDVVMFDARGHGESARPGSYSFGEHVRDLVGVLETLDVQPAVLVGHSMGGAHVAAVAAEHPALVRGLVLVDPHWPLNPAGYDVAGWQVAMAANKAMSLDELLAIGRRENPSWVEQELDPWARAKQAVEPAVATWLNSTHEIDGWREIAQQIRCLTLLFTGDASDVTVGAEGAAQAQGLCPSLAVAHIPAAGHSIHRDQYGSFLAALSSFLRHV